MHFFNIATNLCSRFTIGYPNDSENFFLIGRTENDKPMISCRVLDKRGKTIYGLKDNNLSENSGQYRILVTREGWHRVTDDDGHELLLIETRLDNKGTQITFIRGEFYDKTGNLAAKGDERGLLVNCPLMM
jgi:hypothetical protein